MKMFDKKMFFRALGELDRLLPAPLALLVGGAAALIAAYEETEVTKDVDAVPLKSKLTFEELKPFLLIVAEKLDLPKDWMNPYFESYTHLLPADYESRTREIFSGKNLRCLALGPEDLLIMKLMAGRQKDERHIRRLLRSKDVRLTLVENRLEELSDQCMKGASEALGRFDEVKSDLEIT